MASVVKTVKSGNATLDALLTEYHWSGFFLTYATPRRGQWSGYESGTEPYYFYQELNDAQELAVYRVLNNEVGRVTGLFFTELTNEATQIPDSEKPTSADLRFGQTLYAPGGPAAAFAYLPTQATNGSPPGTPDHRSGDVWFYNDEEDTHPGAFFADPVRGNYEYFTYLHEIGHAMGMKHPHEVEGIFGAMPLGTDQMAYTVMSYRSYEGQGTGPDGGYTNGDWDFPQTYMIWDIAALQYMYGANYRVRDEDNVYSWNPANGQTRIDGGIWLSPGGNKIFMTVWDGGGIDTYDLSAYESDLSVNLNPEAWTITSAAQTADLGDGHYAPGNIANARLYNNNSASLIENAIGGSGNDSLIGNQAANRLTGNGGDDLLDGRAGADTMVGGAGNDHYLVDNSGDTIVEVSGEGADSVDIAAVTWVLGDNVETMIGVHATLAQTLTGNNDANLIRGNNFNNNALSGAGGADRIEGGSGSDKLYGGTGADVLLGNGGADRLEGGDDADSLEGGIGDDLLIGGAGADLILGGEGADKIVYLAVSDSLDGAMDHVLLFASGTDKIDLTALVISALSWSELVDAADSTVYSLVSVTSSGSAMAIRVDAHLVQADFLIGQFVGPTEGADTLSGTNGPDILNGLGGNDTINGLGGNDVIDGGSGADSMRGGAGDDVFYVDSGADGVLELAGEGADEVRTGLASYTLVANVENLIGTSNGGQTLTGNDAVNIIRGGSGNDVLDGRAGADTMVGGAGDDIYRTDEAGDLAVELTGEGSDQVWTNAASYTLGANIEILSGQLGTGQVLTGNDGANTIYGGSGNDLIDGGLGADSTSGGAGNDVYLVDNVGDLVSEFGGGGSDEVRTALASYTLGSNVENLTGTSNAGQTLTGNSWDNVITGGGGNDVLNGDFGADQMIGGAGDDIYYLNEAGDSIVELAGQGTDEIRTFLASGSLAFLPNFENITGLGNVNQTLTGNDGDDVIDGGLGADTMIGGGGNDLYFADNAGDSIVENGGEGSDEVRTALASYSIAAFANVELLTGTGSLDQSLTGNGSDNVIDGGAGADTMTGGLGNDVYYLDSLGDVVVENGGEGIDEVRTALGSFSLLATPNVENLVATGNAAHIFRGNAADNLIAGAGGNDQLFVQDGGNDRANGGGGDDIVYFGGALNALDAVDGGSGARDVLVLQGNYDLGFAPMTMSGIEFLSLQSGSVTRFGDTAGNLYDYDLTLTDANVGAGVQLVVNAQSLLAGEDLTFDGSAELDGRFLVYGGHGVDTLKGGAGNDIFFFEGVRFGASDAVDGGGGRDSLVIAGVNGLNHIEFGETALTSIESISVNNRFATDPSAVPTYELVLRDGNVASGAAMTINASSLGAGQTVNVDAHLELDGAFNMFGGGGHDVFVGGAKGDLIYAAGGADTLTGGAGADTFQYRSHSDSAIGANDRITDFVSGTDRIDLGFVDADTASAGNQVFSFIGASAFTGHAGELRAVFDAGGNAWTVSGDVDGDGFADFLIAVGTATPDPLLGSDFIL